MLTWNTTLKFCHFCGNEMKKTYSGCLRKCSSGCEKKEQYPPIHPVAITRVLDHNREKALLVRQIRYPKGMYSCTATFMKPGDTLEDCVRRAAKEAGIVVEEIKYLQSQTWPLPQSTLMLGASAIAMPGSTEVGINFSLILYSLKKYE
jgi:NAD+ diphosphatase